MCELCEIRPATTLTYGDLTCAVCHEAIVGWPPVEMHPMVPREDGDGEEANG